MNKDLDGNDPQGIKWTQQVTRWFCVESVDDVSFTEDDKCLQTDMTKSNIGG